MAATALLLAAVLASAPASYVVRNVRVFDGVQMKEVAAAAKVRHARRLVR
jgi:hypothetical protein